MQHLGMEDWSLQAIVRGSSGEFFASGSTTSTFLDFSGAGMQQKQYFDDGFFDSFAGIFDVPASMDSSTLEGIYDKPIGTYNHDGAVHDQFQERCLKEINYREDDQQQKLMEALSDRSSSPGNISGGDGGSNSKYKRRKSQQKRVVVQVSADELNSDKWAWRKYGQKPIKGSPYPRSYYRCSSSKGCLARKQVEQSCTDPGMFILTYSAEHCHALPKRRNSLCGTIRQKFPSPNSPHALTNVKPESADESSHLARFSPSELSDHQYYDHETRTKVEEPALRHDYILDDEFFSGLEDLDDFMSDLSLPHSFG